MEDEQLNGQISESRPKIEPVGADYPGKKTLIRGQWYREEDHDEVVRRAKEEREAELEQQAHAFWEHSTGGELCIEMYNAFQAYKEYIQARYPHPFIDKMRFKEHRLFARTLKWAERLAKDRAETDRKNLEKAQLAERCEHIHASTRALRLAQDDRRAALLQTPAAGRGAGPEARFGDHGRS